MSRFMQMNRKSHRIEPQTMRTIDMIAPEPTRRHFLKTCCWGALAAAVPYVGQAAEKRKRTNVVIILADDQGWGDLRVHGNVNLHTSAHRLAGP